MKIKDVIHMSLFQNREFYCQCSKCSKKFEIMAYTRSDAMKRFRSHGFSFGAAGVVCDKCKPAPAGGEARP